VFRRNSGLNYRCHFNRKKMEASYSFETSDRTEGHSINGLDSWRNLIRVFCRDMGYSDDFRGFPQSLRVNFGLATRQSRDNFGIIGVFGLRPSSDILETNICTD
jgi:hypothetical protein